MCGGVSQSVAGKANDDAALGFHVDMGEASCLSQGVFLTSTAVLLSSF